MNFRQKAVTTIKGAIPKEILDLGLRDFKKYRGVINIDTLIDKNILSGMYDDMSISRGVSINLKVDQLRVTFTNESETVLEMPRQLYPDRKIMSVTEFITGTLMGDLTSNRTPLSDLNRSTGPQIFGAFDAGVEALSDREIYIEQPLSTVEGGEFVVRLSYGKDLREINPHYYMAFADIAIKKAKAWLYNKLVIKINSGQLYHGHNLSSIESIVNRWEDMDQEYRDDMNVRGSKMLYMNDKKVMKNYVGLNFDPVI